jgi:hypothetical protein
MEKVDTLNSSQAAFITNKIEFKNTESFFRTYAGKFELKINEETTMHLHLIAQENKLFINLPYPSSNDLYKKFELTPGKLKSDSKSGFFSAEAGVEIYFPVGNINLMQFGSMEAKRIPLTSTAQFTVSTGSPTDSVALSLCNHSALKKLFDEDQKERKTGKFSSPEEENKRRIEAELILSDIPSPTKEDFYYIAVIFHHSNSIDDYKKANHYAKKSFDIGFFNSAEGPDNRWLYAATFDRLQIEQDLPQQFGTQRYGRGEKIDQLIEAKGHTVDRERINIARTTLGLDSLAQEEEKIINPSRKERGLGPLPSKVEIVGKINENSLRNKTPRS